MNLGINTRLLLKNRTEGIGRFIEESLKELVLLRPNDTFYFFFDRPFDKDFIFAENIIPIVVYPPARHPILWTIWFDYLIPYYCSKYKIDLFYSPEMYVSKRLSIPQVSVIHDINFIHKPELVPGWNGRYFRKNASHFAKISDQILTVSEFSSSDISKVLNVSSSKLNVCYNGVSQVFKPVNVESPNKSPFFLMFGAINPRKNIENTLLAFDLFKSNVIGSHQLIFIGEKMLWTESMEACLSSLKFKDDVLFLGRLPDVIVNEYLNHALALLYVSFFEGFGLPIVEAQQCECPVITSETSCMPEIAGEGALFVNPNKFEKITEAMKLVIESSIKSNLISKGIYNAKRFSWKSVAEKINTTINKVLC